MNVLELLEEIEDIVDTAPNVPMTGKVVIDGDTLLEIVADIRKSLPDDVHQAKWIKEQKERIIDESKQEYEKIIIAAKKEAEDLVDNNDITLKARERANMIYNQTVEYTNELKIRTYDYVENILYDMQKRIDHLHVKYYGDVHTSIEESFATMDELFENNRNEMKSLAYEIKNGKSAKPLSSDEITEE